MSDVLICNMALGFIGVNQFIDDLDEASINAQTCRLYFEPVRHEILAGDFDWPFARRYRDLALVEEQPGDGWSYSYRYPSDCLAVRRVATHLGLRHPRPPAYLIGSDPSGRLIYTDEPNARIQYTTDVPDASRFPAPFRTAMAWLLATYIAPSLSKTSNLQAVIQGLRAQHDGALRTAQVGAMNEHQAQKEPESEFIRVREVDA